MDRAWEQALLVANDRMVALTQGEHEAFMEVDGMRAVFVGMAMDAGMAVEHAMMTAEEVLATVARGDANPHSAITGAIMRTLMVGGLVTERAEQCEHDWVDVRNQAMLSGEWCQRCGRVRAGNLDV